MKKITHLAVTLCATALFTPLSQAQNLVVGDNSSGVTTNITSGTNSYDNTVIGNNVGADSNSLTVDGSGTLLTNSAEVTVGQAGSGNSMAVSDGGVVANVDGYIGRSTDSANNTVLVTGSGSRWAVGELRVGRSGIGNSLVISNGGTVAGANTNHIGRNPSSANNSVLVTGAGSMWTISNQLNVGTLGSGNSLVISNGGRVQNTLGRIGSGGASVNNSALVTGLGSTWSNSSTLTVGNSGSGTLTVANGGSVAATGITIAASNGSAGTLNIGRFGTNDTAGTITAPTIAFGSGTGTINFNQSNATTLSNAISGNGTLNQRGAGTTILSASNTYTGATTVAAGKLVVDGSIAASAVTVQSGGTLGGSGKVGATTIQSGGTISPGNSPGNLTVQGNLVWNGGGNYNWQVLGTTNTAGFAAGVTWDLLTVNGTLDLTALAPESKFNINLWSLASTAPDVSGNIADFSAAGSYEWLAVVASSITGFDAADFNVNLFATNGTDGFSNPIEPTGTFSVRQDGGNLYVTYGVVPEPSTYALLALAAAGLGAHAWRRRKSAKVPL